MVTEEDCFIKLSEHTENIQTYFKDNFDNLQWHEHESLWNLALVPLDVLLENSTLKLINHEFNKKNRHLDGLFQSTYHGVF